ncbi:MAG: MarR family winged helix-turn-helix transcriptional regulator [Thomasclavelia sp.]|nr:MarR family winged helix-turn-helix transcriptional regulator [Thomasclavelia sp.]
MHNGECNPSISVFHDVEKALRMMMTTFINELGMSTNEFFTIATIEKFDISNQKELSKFLHITPASLSVRLDKLEQNGYIKREVDKNDRRNTIVITTKKSKDIFSKNQEIEKIIKETIFKGFSSEDKEQFINYLNKIKDNVDNYTKEHTYVED